MTFDYIRHFKGTNDIHEKDIPILKELELFDNCAVVVMGITYNNFKNTKNVVSVEQNNVQIDKKKLKEYEKVMKDDMRGRIELKNYMKHTNGGR